MVMQQNQNNMNKDKFQQDNAQGMKSSQKSSTQDAKNPSEKPSKK